MNQARGAIFNVAVIFAACASIIGISNRSWAWGAIGHEAIAMIAEQNMTPQTLQAVNAILGDMTILDAAIWPDQIKYTAGWHHTAAYHFADTETGQSYFDDFNRPNFTQNGDVIRALLAAEDVLRNSSSTAQQKQYAMAFLIHFVGDLHQPLHEGHPEDLGGNTIKADFFGKRTNLHAIWDSGMINQVIQNASVNVDQMFGLERLLSYSYQGPTEQDVQTFVSQIRTPTPVEVAAWQNSFILDWSVESTADREDIYNNWTGDDQGYQQQYATYAEERILRAGYRLAGWLDAIMANQPFQQQKDQDLRQKIAQIVGDSNPIVLESVDDESNYSAFNDPCANDDDVMARPATYNALGL